MKKLLLLSSVLTISACIMDVEKTNSASYQMDIQTHVDTLVIDNNDTIFSVSYDTLRVDSTVFSKDTINISSIDTITIKESKVDTLVSLTKDTLVVTRKDTITLNNVDTLISTNIDTIYQVSEFSMKPRFGLYYDTLAGDTIRTVIQAGYELFEYGKVYANIYFTRFDSLVSTDIPTCPVGFVTMGSQHSLRFMHLGIAKPWFTWGRIRGDYLGNGKYEMIDTWSRNIWALTQLYDDRLDIRKSSGNMGLEAPLVCIREV